MTLDVKPADALAGPGASPYRGLMPFTEADAELFFGREAEVRLIVHTARARRFGVLYGPSGVGKSSVLQAGVIRQIREENQRRFERFGAVETVVAYLKEWRDDPFAALRVAIREGFATMPGASELGAAVPSEDQESDDIVDEVLALRSSRHVDLLLILDQFEEFFLYHRSRAEEFAEFLDRLIERGNRVNVLVALREDALALLDEFEADIPDVFDNTLRLEHLDEAAAESAVRKPLEHYNARVPEEKRVRIEESLVAELLSQVRTGRVQVDSSQEQAESSTDHHHSTAVRIEAPYLQLVLTRLWEEETARQSSVLRLATLRELGGAQEIVREHLNRVMRAFAPSEMEVLADAFGHLVTPSGSKIAHRPSDLAEFSGRDPAQVAGLLRRLAEGDQRILREVPSPMDEPHSEPRYEIFHDVLALAVLDWRRRYLAEADTKRQQAALLAENERVEQETREAKRRLRRAQLLVSVMALLLVACGGLIVWALQSRSSAEASERKALASNRVAELNAKLDEVNRLLRTDPAAALALAQEFPLGGELDAGSRFEAAYRKALDAADTDVKLELGSPVVLAEFDAEDDLVTVTEDLQVQVWSVRDSAPMRLDEDPQRVVDVPGEGSARVSQAVISASGRYVVVVTDAGDLASVELASGDVEEFQTDLGEGITIATAEYGARDHVVADDSEGNHVLLDVAAHKVVPAPGLRRPVASAALDVAGRYLAVVTSGSQKIQVWGMKSRRLVAETTLASHTDQTIQFGRIAFTDVPSGSGPVLLVLATGWHTEAAVWDVRGEDAPTPLGTGKNATWRQVYDWADVWYAAADEPERYSGLVAVAGDKGVRLFDARGEGVGGLRSNTVNMNDWATGVQINPSDTSVFAVASNEGFVELYRQTTFTPPRPIWTFRGHSGTISQLRWSEDGKNLVTASRDGTVRVWRVPVTESLWYSADWILGSTFTADGRYLFGFTPGGYVVRSDPQGGDLTNKFVSLYGQIIDMDPAPDGRRAVIAEGYCGPPLKVTLAEEVETVPLDEPEGSDVCLTSVAWNPDPDRQQVVGATYDGRLIAWDAESGEVTASAELGPSWTPVHAVDISQDGETVVAATGGAEAGRIHVLSAADLSPARNWPASDADRLDVSADGRYVATAGNDRHLVRVWDVEDPDQSLQELRQATGTLGNVTLSQDEEASRVAVTTSEGLVYVWDRTSGGLLAVLRSHGDAANQAAFDPSDIDRVVSAGDDGEMSSITCELCSLDADDLGDLLEDRLAQPIKLGE